MLTKALPTIALAFGAQKGMEKFKPLLEYTKVTATQAELSQIGKIITLDSIDGIRISTDQEQFKKYVQKNMKSGKREDTSIDLWGKSYRLKIEGHKAIILSDGPDTTEETTDDLKYIADLYG